MDDITAGLPETPETPETIIQEGFNPVNTNLSPAEIANLTGYINVIKSFIEGKRIEVSTDSGVTWEVTDYPHFNFQMCQYRVKPEILYLYYCVYRTVLGSVHTSVPMAYESYIHDVVNKLQESNYDILEECKITITNVL